MAGPRTPIIVYDMNMGLFETSTGHRFSSAEWLDLHYGAAEPEYEAMVQSVRFQAGWRVLDAGCGNGRFTSVIAEIVGTKGRVDAVDLAPENIDILKKRLQTQRPPCPVNAQVGNVLSLPHPEKTFDALWCSGVAGYLSEDELKRALEEFKRVVRPGGIVAIKESEGTLLYFYPTPDLTLIWRSAEGMDFSTRQRWFVYPIQMKHSLESVGLTGVRQETTLVERRQPLREVERKYISTRFALQDLSWAKIDLLPKIDQIAWQSISAEDSIDELMRHPDFYWREGHIVATGKVPEG
jgi:arsenite methyltransferase